MPYYETINISKYETGLVQEREEFLIPNDAFPILENMYVWREAILRKSGSTTLGRLKRELTGQNLGNTDGAGAFSGNIKTILTLETNADMEPGTLSISDGTNTFTDDGAGVITGAPAGSGTINYSTMALTLAGGAATQPLIATFKYHPSLPVMGLESRELNNINNEQMIAFDTKYAYTFIGGEFDEWITGTTWSGTDSDFFWTTNYFVGDNNSKIFWATNFSGPSGDPIRYSNGSSWNTFNPQINAAGDILFQCRAMLPFRGRLVTFNTWEGPGGSLVNQRQRIRWSAIGTPFTTVVGGVVSSVNANAWRDDITGQGGFLDIPTAENIITVGSVRDNLVIYCERSTWQLRYTGRSIAPFQIEKVNTELGAESTFSAIQFDTTLVGIGDKGIVQCDSFKSERIDVKIPDLVYRFTNENDGPARIHGIRDFQQRLAYWCYPDSGTSDKFPNRRLVYNYENDSWAIFKDSFTSFGTYQEVQSDQWQDFPGPDDADTWQAQNYPWLNIPAQFPSLVGGNQQGYVMYLGNNNFNASAVNGKSLHITNITGNTTTPTVVTSPDHNMEEGTIIRIEGIPTGTPFASSLNNQIFYAEPTSDNDFKLWKYDETTMQFSDPQLDAPDTYIGIGEIVIRDNFRILTKKFNYLEKGQSIQFGMMDLLLENTSDGQITFNIYDNYNTTEPLNQFPQNTLSINTADTFFNTTIPTEPETYTGSSKVFQKLYCNTRGSLLSFEFTLSDAQMVSDSQEKPLRIDSLVLYLRPAGKQLISR